MNALRVGVMGCGNIAPIYLKNLGNFSETSVTAVADMDRERAKSRADEFGVAQVLEPEDLLRADDVDLVLDLTPAGAHFRLNMDALDAGKHVYTEKPLSAKLEQGKDLVRKAEERGLLLGCAPDTVLGAGIQTCRKLIDDGAIGAIVGAQAFMMGRGPEGWHPDPEHFYLEGGGPMYDMGPYYLSALVTLLGPVDSVVGSARITFPTRTIGSEKKRGQQIPVETATHVTGLLEFGSGATAQITTSFDVWAHHMPCIEIYGSEGTLSVPDPNTFGGPVRLFRGGGDWEEVELSHGFAENSRGLGVKDLAMAKSESREPRASGKLALHVLEVMHGIHEASRNRAAYAIQTKIDRPKAMPAG